MSALMRKRAYIWLASHQRDEIRIANLTGEPAAVAFATQSVHRMAQALSSDNPNFDTDRYLRAVFNAGKLSGGRI